MLSFHYYTGPLTEPFIVAHLSFDINAFLPEKWPGESPMISAKDLHPVCVGYRRVQNFRQLSCK